MSDNENDADALMSFNIIIKRITFKFITISTEPIALKLFALNYPFKMLFVNLVLLRLLHFQELVTYLFSTFVKIPYFLLFSKLYSNSKSSSDIT